MSQALHFCWIGQRMEWAQGFALLSAARHGGLDEVKLHHTDDLAETPVIRALQNAGITFSRIFARRLLTETGEQLGLGAGLADLYETISAPAILSDILRAAILYREGGIYLDTDTLTLANLNPLLTTQQFIGLENIVWPYWVKSSRAPLAWSRALSLDLLRKCLRRAPKGWLWFRFIEHLYFKAVNGAVMGGAAHASLFASYLQAMLTLPAPLQQRANMLGPDLLQSLIARHSFEGLKIYEPAWFYPLPPEISQHWFRPCQNAKLLLKRALKPQSMVAHWYASVRSKPYVKQIDPDFVRTHQNTQLYSALVCRLLPEVAGSD